jgi:hypothetical protein
MSLYPNREAIGSNMIEDIMIEMKAFRSSNRALSTDLLWGYLQDGAAVVAGQSKARKHTWEIDLKYLQREYEFPPDCLQIDSFKVVYPNGFPTELFPETYGAMDAMYPYWTADNPNINYRGFPEKYILENVADNATVSIFPIPIYSYPKGIRIFGVRSESDWTPDQLCPFSHRYAVESITAYAKAHLARSIEITEPSGIWKKKIIEYEQHHKLYLARYKAYVKRLQNRATMASHGGIR